MTVVLVIVLLTLVAAIFLLRVSHGHAEAVAGLDELCGRTLAVDIEAFRNLIDPTETDFLRTQLPAADFRRVQRERTRATLEYVRRIAHNAAVLLRLGQSARTHPDPDVARAAHAMVDRALTVRLAAMRALVQLYLQLLVPVPWLTPEALFERYRTLTDTVIIFTRLQRPAYAGRVNAMI